MSSLVGAIGGGSQESSPGLVSPALLLLSLDSPRMARSMLIMSHGQFLEAPGVL